MKFKTLLDKWIVTDKGTKFKIIHKKRSYLMVFVNKKHQKGYYPREITIYKTDDEIIIAIYQFIDDINKQNKGGKIMKGKTILEIELPLIVDVCYDKYYPLQNQKWYEILEEIEAAKDRLLFEEKQIREKIKPSLPEKYGKMETKELLKELIELRNSEIENADIDIIATGMAPETIDQKEKVLVIIKRLSKRVKNKTADRADIISEGEIGGMPEDQTETILDMCKRDGTIYEPQKNKYVITEY